MKKTKKSKKTKRTKNTILILMLILSIILITLDYASGMKLRIIQINYGVILLYITSLTYFLKQREAVKKSVKHLRETKNYFLIIAGIFLITAIIGFAYPNFFNEQILKILQELVDKTQDLKALELIGFIFTNNLKSSFFAMIFGTLLGIIPLMVTIINGYVLGFVANKTVGMVGYSVLWRLLPHGIFELPAVFISIGIGLRLGMYTFSKKQQKKSLMNTIKDSLRTFTIIIMPLLIIAAIIEGTLIHILG